MAVTKTTIANAIQNQLDTSSPVSFKIVETLLAIIKKSLESGDDVMISGFGKFSVKEKKQRKGRNPSTGQRMMLDARRVVKFHCSGKLREKVNGK